jgi:hypothetical protein
LFAIAPRVTQGYLSLRGERKSEQRKERGEVSFSLLSLEQEAIPSKTESEEKGKRNVTLLGDRQ